MVDITRELHGSFVKHEYGRVFDALPVDHNRQSVLVAFVKYALRVTDAI